MSVGRENIFAQKTPDTMATVQQYMIKGTFQKHQSMLLVTWPNWGQRNALSQDLALTLAFNPGNKICNPNPGSLTLSQDITCRRVLDHLSRVFLYKQ